MKVPQVSLSLKGSPGPTDRGRVEVPHEALIANYQTDTAT